MKYKFVNVWDNGRYGRVPHIILQVEEKDYFLTKNDFNPGYKIVIRATKGLVGAAGGHTFNPYYYEESVQKRSRKIDSNESDVLGFYLSHINDIYDIPTELYTEEFWNVLLTSRESYRDFNSELSDEYMLTESEYDNHYKVLARDTMFGDTLNEKFDFLDEILTKMENRNDEDSLLHKNIKDTFQISRKRYKKYLDVKLERRIEFIIIEKETLKVVDNMWSSDNKSTVADYLWCPFEELPEELWKSVIDDEGEPLKFLEMIVE